MFGFFSKKKETATPLHSVDSQAESILIHTMAVDLESLSPSQKESDKDSLKNASRPASKADSKSFSEQQKSSPFLNIRPTPGLPTPPVPRPKLESFAKPISGPLIKEIPASDLKAKDDTAKKQTVPTKEGSKKLIVTLILILIITIVLAGGYYFWSTRKSIPTEETAIQETDAEQVFEDIPTEESAGEEEQLAPAFSATERNYFMLDMGSGSLASFKEMIGSYYEKIVDSKISYSVEFTIINKENNPVDFKTFAQALGIKFSPELLSALEDDFSLYIYNDRGNPGVGLSVKVKGGMSPEDILLKEERNLPRELEPLFPVSQYTIVKDKAFATSEYDSTNWGKIGIRFQNIISPENLSVDYAFINTGTERLLVATTKETIRATIESQKADITAP